MIIEVEIVGVAEENQSSGRRRKRLHSLLEAASFVSLVWHRCSLFRRAHMDEIFCSSSARRRFVGTVVTKGASDQWPLCVPWLAAVP